MEDVARNDGELGELDFVDPNTNDVRQLGRLDRRLGRQRARRRRRDTLNGNGGDDALGGAGGDRLVGGTGADIWSAAPRTTRSTPATTRRTRMRCEGGTDDTLTADLRDTTRPAARPSTTSAC